MKLFRIENGWTGNSNLYVLVFAENSDRALELARSKFREEAEREKKVPSFWTNLEIEEVLELDNEWCSEVRDG